MIPVGESFLFLGATDTRPTGFSGLSQPLRIFVWRPFGQEPDISPPGTSVLLVGHVG